MNVKKELIISVIGTVIIILLTFFYISQYQIQNNQPKTISPAVQQSVNQNFILTLEEISKHNKESDCWQIINDVVYDITDYLSQHPDGGEIMIPYCGADATEAYDTKAGRGKPHSARANQDLETLKVGLLKK